MSSSFKKIFLSHFMCCLLAYNTKISKRSFGKQDFNIIYKKMVNTVQLIAKNTNPKI